MYCNLVILFCFISLVRTETSKETSKDFNQPTLKMLVDYMSTPESWETNPHLKSLWVYRPAPLQHHGLDNDESQNVVLKPPYQVTKLAKPVGFSIDPYFSKDYYEPFERRRKPVMLLSFRKRGYIPKKNMLVGPSQEPAELQSPYNEINSNWPEYSETIL